jgi:hypothetical protein
VYAEQSRLAHPLFLLLAGPGDVDGRRAKRHVEV